MFPLTFSMATRYESCRVNNCLEVILPFDIHLRPYNIHKITLSLIDVIPQGCAIEVQNHLCNKPWRVINKYLFPHKISHCITFYLTSNLRQTLASGVILCHINVISSTELIDTLTGNNYT